MSAQLMKALLEGGVVLGVDGGRAGAWAALAWTPFGPKLADFRPWVDTYGASGSGHGAPIVANSRIVAVCFEAYHRNRNGNSATVPEVEIPAATVAACLASFRLPYCPKGLKGMPAYFRPVAATWRKAVLGAGNFDAAGADRMALAVLRRRGLVPEEVDGLPEGRRGHVVDAIAQALYAYDLINEEVRHE